MRPRPSELITGIRAILSDTVLPELTSEHARSRLSEIRAVLAQVDWDDAAFALKARASALADVLGRTSSWVDAAVPEPPTSETFSGYQDYWERLAVVATDVMDGLSVHLDAHPNDDDARAAYAELLDVV